MDSITHVALGACLGELLGAKKLGKKALVFGAIAQNIPDVDVLASVWLEPSVNLLAHRGFTHSFFFATLFSILLAFGARRLWPDAGKSFQFWLLFFGVQIFVHCIIDACNNYGTGWFEPFSHYRVSFHVLYVMDPFFLLPTLVVSGLLASILKGRSRIVSAGMAIFLSVCYIGYGVANKLNQKKIVAAALASQKIETDQYLTTPTPFNTWLWFVVVSQERGQYVGYHSVFDSSEDITFEFFPRNDTLLETLNDQREVDYLKRFSQGYFTVEQEGDTIVFNDLRFGQIGGWRNPRADFVFHYYLYPPLDNTLVMQRGRFTKWDKDMVRALVRRILGED